MTLKCCYFLIIYLQNLWLAEDIIYGFSIMVFFQSGVKIVLYFLVAGWSATIKTLPCANWEVSQDQSWLCWCERATLAQMENVHKK